MISKKHGVFLFSFLVTVVFGLLYLTISGCRLTPPPPTCFELNREEANRFLALIADTQQNRWFRWHHAFTSHYTNLYYATIHRGIPRQAMLIPRELADASFDFSSGRSKADQKLFNLRFYDFALGTNAFAVLAFPSRLIDFVDQKDLTATVEVMIVSSWNPKPSLLLITAQDLFSETGRASILRRSKNEN